MVSKTSPVSKTEATAAAAPAAEVKVEDGTGVAPTANTIAKPKAVSKDTNGNQIEEN